MHIEKDYKRQVVQIMEKLNSFYKCLKIMQRNILIRKL